MFKRIALTASVLCVLALPTAAIAGGPVKSSISLVAVSATASTTSNPRFGDQVTFNISTSATDKPYVNINCYQNGTWVEGGWSRYYDDPIYPWSRVFTLGPTQLWPGGAADCTARLVMFTSNGRDRTLASTNFHVDA